MKDYHDLLLLVRGNGLIESQKLKEALEKTNQQPITSEG